MKLPLKIRRRHHPTVAKGLIAVAILGVIAASIPGMQPQFERLSQIRDRAAVISTEQELAGLEKERLAEQSKLADELYRKGCNTIVVSPNDPSKFASLVKGQTVINPNTGQVLAAGLSICTDKGEASTLVDNGMGQAVVGDIYTTQNFDLVRKALALHGINAQSGDGNVGGANAQIKH